MDSLRSFKDPMLPTTATSIFDNENGPGVCKWQGNSEVRYDTKKRTYFSASNAQQDSMQGEVVRTVLKTSKERDAARTAIIEAAREIEEFFGNEASVAFFKKYKNQLESGEPLTVAEIKDFSESVAAQKNGLEPLEHNKSEDRLKKLHRNIEIALGGRSVDSRHAYQKIPNEDKPVDNEPLVGFNNKLDFSKTLNSKPLFEWPKIPFFGQRDVNKPVLTQADFEGKEIPSKSNDSYSQRVEKRANITKDATEKTSLLTRSRVRKDSV